MKLFYLTILFSISTCSLKNDLSQSEWRYYFDKKHFSFISFNENSNYIEFDSEIGEHYYGTYEVKGDTIILHQERGEYDHEFPNSHHVAGKTISKLILKNYTQLGYLQNWDSEKGKWKEEFYYTKITNPKK